MLIGEPGKTNYDLNFPFLGFPVRVHPGFFVLPLLLGRGLISYDVNTGVGLLLVAAIFFASILVHELGHALAFRYYRIRSYIILYWLGGLACPDVGGWNSSSTRLSSNQQIVVSLAGPVFGLLLSAAFIGLTYLMGGHVILNDQNIIPLPQPVLHGTPFDSSVINMIMFSGVALNIFWNVLNLVPIYPLDGGQITRELMVQMDSANGIKNSIIVSAVASGMLAVFMLMNGMHFAAILFGYLAWTSFQSLQGYGRPRW